MKLTEKLIILALLAIPVMCLFMHCTSSETGDSKSGMADKVKITDDIPRPEKLTIGYVPSATSSEAVTENDELNKLLSDKLGIPVDSKIILNPTMSITGLGSGQLDCAMVSPLAYVIGVERFPLVPLLKVVKNEKTEYYSQILVNNESGIETIADLKGHKFAFVNLMSTSGHLYARSLMARNGINVETDLDGDTPFVGSHDKVALDVMNGAFDAGATFQDVRERVSEKYPDIMAKTKVIAVAGPIPNEMFCVTTDMDERFKNLLKEALIEISKGIEINGEIKKPLFDLDEIEELVDASDADYEPVRYMIENLDFDFVSEVSKSVE